MMYQCYTKCLVGFRLIQHLVVGSNKSLVSFRQKKQPGYGVEEKSLARVRHENTFTRKYLFSDSKMALNYFECKVTRLKDIDFSNLPHKESPLYLKPLLII